MLKLRAVRLGYTTLIVVALVMATSAPLLATGPHAELGAQISPRPGPYQWVMDLVSKLFAFPSDHDGPGSSTLQASHYGSTLHSEPPPPPGIDPVPQGGAASDPDG